MNIRINSIVAAHIGNVQFTGRVIMVVTSGDKIEYTIETGFNTCERVLNTDIDRVVTF